MIRGGQGTQLRGAPSAGEARAAVISAAGLYVAGATLIATTVLLPHVSSPGGAAAVAITAMVTAGLLVISYVQRRGGLLLAWVAEMWGVILIALLCASTGGASSPFALIYFFAAGHAAAFQPQGRFLLVSGAAMIAFLAPLLYSHVSSNFWAYACVGVVLALLTIAVVHTALGRMRQERARLQLLIAATARFDSSLDPQQTLRRIAATALPDLADLCVIDLIDEDGAITSTVAASVDPAVATRIERARREQGPEIMREHPVGRALDSREPLIVRDLATMPALRALADLPGGASGRSGTVIPMVARGRMLGAISFVHREGPVRDRLALLEDLSGRAALAYDNARLYAERARVAHTLRRSLMPAALPAIPGLELESYFRPMGAGSEVGGDFYDVFEDGEGCWLVVGDVCGKGADAAVLTAFLRHTTIAYAREGDSPATVLGRVNQAMLEQDFEGRFATAILARLGRADADTPLTVAAAGHPAALVVRAGGGAEELGERGTLLGVFPDARVVERSTVLRSGDSLALYTDGLTEAHAPRRLLSAQEMIGALSRNPPGSARETIGTLLDLVDLREALRDDVAILAARVTAARLATPPATPTALLD